MSENQGGSKSSVWDAAADSYELLRYADPVYLSCIRQVTKAIKQGSKICLDAGCGTGLSSVALSKRSNLVIAVDYSIESLRVLKEKGISNIIPVQADLRALPFKESVFDAVVCANTLQHFKPGLPQKSVVAELRRCTKEEGLVGVSVHHFSRTKHRAGWIKEGKPGQPGIDYIFRFLREDLLAIMPHAHIKAVGYYGLSKIPFIGNRLQDLLALLLGRMNGLLGYGHMLLALEQKDEAGR